MNRKLTIYSLKKLTIVLLWLLAPAVQAQNAYFSIVNGIPHLPVVPSLAAAGTGIPGALMYSTAEAQIYIWADGTNKWVSICTQLPPASGSFSQFTTSGGYPLLPVLSSTSVTSTTGQSGTMYYSSNSKGIIINNGSAWFPIGTLSLSTTAAPVTTSYTVAGNLTGLAGGFAPPVLANDPAFVSTDKGAFYLNATDKKLHVNTGTAWVAQSCPYVCPPSVTATFYANPITPVSSTTNVIYNTVSTATRGLNACWITANLGATTPPTSLTDASTTAAGWLYIWPDNQNHWGYLTDGTTTTPTKTWAVVNAPLFTTYYGGRDPCNASLGSGWRLPSDYEFSVATAPFGYAGAGMVPLHCGGSWIFFNGALGTMTQGYHAPGSDITKGSYLYMTKEDISGTNVQTFHRAGLDIYGTPYSGSYSLHTGTGATVRCVFPF